MTNLISFNIYIYIFFYHYIQLYIYMYMLIVSIFINCEEHILFHIKYVLWIKCQEEGIQK